MRHVLDQFWTSPTLRCVLTSVGEPAFLTVQIMSGERVMHSQMVAARTQRTIVSDNRGGRIAACRARRLAD